MEAVSAVLWTFSSLVDGCVAAVCLFLRINELLGSVTLAALYYATVVVQYLGAGLCQAYRELVFFMQDIVSLVHFIVSVTDILVHGSADCIVMTVTSLSRLSTFLKESFVSGCNGASSAALQVVSSSRNFLGLFFQISPTFTATTSVHNTATGALCVLWGVWPCQLHLHIRSNGDRLRKKCNRHRHQ